MMRYGIKGARLGYEFEGILKMGSAITKSKDELVASACHNQPYFRCVCNEPLSPSPRSKSAGQTTGRKGVGRTTNGDAQPEDLCVLTYPCPTQTKRPLAWSGLQFLCVGCLQCI